MLLPKIALNQMYDYSLYSYFEYNKCYYQEIFRI
jgi:hypothetical protein